MRAEARAAARQDGFEQNVSDIRRNGPEEKKC